jgi:formamidopyrimidine-DNA glycosylase
MPELPEVENAVQLLRAGIDGKTVARARLLHPALRRRLSPARLRAIRGARVTAIVRRGKHQFIEFDDGRRLHVHFRMTGDWVVDRASDPAPRYARAILDFTDGTRAVLTDPRALSTVELYAAGVHPELALGLEPDDPALNVDSLLHAFARRRGPIKPVLLDQRIIAGLGNVYASEALWQARISPLARASELSHARVAKLLSAIRRVIAAATGARYRTGSSARLAVYDREGKPCRRCRTIIERVVQAGRSTYYCPYCQAD